jgi:hypothetical protein
VQHHAAHQSRLAPKRVAKRAEAGRVRACDDAAGLDLQGDQFAVLLEDEIDRAPRPVPPEVK